MARAPSRRAQAGARKNVATPIDSGRIEFKPDEIGGELVSLLSEGLYSNPLDALREYVQNSIDAGAKRVQIKVTGRAIFLRDNGSGMSKEQLVAARRFAVSDKSIASNIGFRGIGIYSAFHLCDKMRIRTKTAGTFVLHTAEYDFASMRKVLGAERGSANAAKTPLVNLLSDYVKFTAEEHANEDSFTVVELLGVSPLYYGMLASRENAEQYILDTIPVHFPKDYPYGDEINARIRAHWPDYKPISIVLQYAGFDDYTVTKRMPPHLERPEYRDVKDDNGRVIAMIWGSRNSEAAMIGAEDDEREYRDLQGFAYKVKGMTVGSRRDSYSTFSQGALYNWWTGEIHVLNDRVIPNASRDGFEYNASARALEIAVNGVLRNEYERSAAQFQFVRRAGLNLGRAQAEYDRLAELALQGVLTPAQMGELANAQKAAELVGRNLTRYEKDATAAQEKSAALLLAEKIKKLLRQARTRSPEEDEGAKPARRKKAASTTSAVLTEDEDFDPDARGRDLTLEDVLATAGSEDATVAASILALLIEVLGETLGASSPQYRAVVAALQSRLSDEGVI